VSQDWPKSEQLILLSTVFFAVRLFKDGQVGHMPIDRKEQAQRAALDAAALLSAIDKIP